MENKVIGRREALKMQQQQFSKPKQVEEKRMNDNINNQNAEDNVKPSVAVKVRPISEVIADNLTETDIALANIGATLKEEEEYLEVEDEAEEFDDNDGMFYDPDVGNVDAADVAEDVTEFDEDDYDDDAEYDDDGEDVDVEDVEDDDVDGDDSGEDEGVSLSESKATMHKINHKLLVTCSIADTQDIHDDPKEVRRSLGSIDLGGEYFSLYNPLRAKGTGEKDSPHSFLKAPLDYSIKSIAKHHGDNGDVRILGTPSDVSTYIEDAAASLCKEVTKNLYTANAKEYDLLFSASEIGESIDSLSDMEEFTDIINNPESYGFTEESVQEVEEMLNGLEEARNEMLESVKESGEIVNIHDIPLDLSTNEETGTAEATEFVSVPSMFKVTSWVDAIEDESVTTHTIVTHISFKSPALYHATRDGEKNKALTSYLLILKSRLRALDIPESSVSIVFGAYISQSLLSLPDEGSTAYWSLADELLHSDDSEFVPTSLADASNQESYLSSTLSVPLDLELEELSSMLFPFADASNTGILFLTDL